MLISLLQKANANDTIEEPVSTRQWLFAVRHTASRVLACALALPLLPLAPTRLAAQQPSWPGPPQYGGYAPSPYPQTGTYGPQYPYQQPAYGQSPYAQPGYGQPQPYSQPAPQQYAPPQYSEQPAPQPPIDDGPPYADLDQSDTPQQAPSPAFTAGQLEQMLAPIALYPDALVAQILAASTYPAQVSLAGQWLRTMGNASPDQVAAEADAQNWDPSVKALTAFPQVLDLMNHDLAWTTDLGNAYYNQPQDVLQTFQVLRQRAQAAGTLQNTPQEQVTEDQGNIELAPPDPNTVYVPQYNPWNAYGEPIQPYPGFSLLGAIGSFLGSSPLQYGLGIAMSAFTHTPFGWLSWALDWLGNAILFNHSAYSSHSTSVAHWGSAGWQGRGGREWAGRDRWNNGNQRDGFARGNYGSSRQEYGYNQNRTYNGYRDNEQYRGSGYASNREPGSRFSTAPGRTYPASPGSSYANGYGREYGYGNNVRPAMPQSAVPQLAYNHSQGYPARSQPVMPARPQPGFGQRPYSPQIARPAYGSGFMGGRSGSYYASPQQFSRAPEQRGFNSRGQQSYSTPHQSFFSHGNSGYSFKSERSGGFHPFGGGGGSHFSAPKPPKSFGGGGHFGGGHSGGGHSSSHGGGGHHH